MIEHLDKIFIASSFFVPGFVLDRTLGFFSPKHESNNIIKIFTFGLLYLVLCSPFIYLWIPGENAVWWEKAPFILFLNIIYPFVIGMI